MGHHRSIFLKRTISAQIHAWGALASALALVSMVLLAWPDGWQRMFAVGLFGVTAVLLFSASAVMHVLTDGYRISKTFEMLLENFDKVSVHLLIAGTYTAIVELSLQEPLRSKILISVWTFAIVGIVYTLLFERLPRFMQSRVLYTSQFLVMGWLVLFCVKEIITVFSIAQSAWALAGGVFYSIGALIYAFKYPNPSRYFGYHEIWHSLVILGCASFFVVVFLGLSQP